MDPRDVHAACALWYSIPKLSVSPTFDTPQQILAYLQHNPGFSSVARHGAQLIGALLCGHDGRRGSFYHAAVLPEFRRQHVATRLVERSLSALHQAGITTAFLFTHENNPPAQAFWHRLGWEHCPGVQYHFRQLDPRQPSS